MTDGAESVLRTMTPNANPNWAQLPLFDRSKWETLPFGDFADCISERAHPVEFADAIYVGLEHLDPENLHIRRWGKGSDVEGVKLRFYKGDIIFGRRRAYQRKLAVAEMDGICSAHAMVVRANPELCLPQFLPFLMMSDAFMKRAVEISVGSLSPTISWGVLKQQSFALPPLDQQRRIAELLWAVDCVVRNYYREIAALDSLEQSHIEAAVSSTRYKRAMLGDLLKSVVAGRSVVGVLEPAGEKEFGVLRISAVGADGFVPEENKRLLKPSDFMERFTVREGDFLITRCNTTEMVGRVCIVDKDYPNLMLCDKTIKLVYDESVALPKFYESILKSRPLREQIEARATGTGVAMKNISQDDIRALNVPMPSLKEQRGIIATLEQVLEARRQARSAVSNANALRASISNAVVQAS